MESTHVIWLAQAGFVITHRGTALLIDPFLSDHDLRRSTPPDPALLPREVAWLLITHEHLDHLDLAFLPRLIDRYPSLRVVLPRPIASSISHLVPDARLVGVAPRDVLALGSGIVAEVIPAYHSVEADCPFSDGSEPGGSARFVGYRIETGGVVLYHSGDTIVTDELIAALRNKRVDVAILPINGRDYFRTRDGIVGNMDAREAVEFAIVLGAQTLVPMHWDLIRGNTVSPGSAVDAATKRGNLHVLNLAPFVPFVFASDDRG